MVGEKSREGVNNFAHNIDYPQNVINHSLQGESGRANDETRRFLTNTTEGGIRMPNVPPAAKVAVANPPA